MAQHFKFKDRQCIISWEGVNRSSVGAGDGSAGIRCRDRVGQKPMRVSKTFRSYSIYYFSLTLCCLKQTLVQSWRLETGRGVAVPALDTSSRFGPVLQWIAEHRNIPGRQLTVDSSLFIPK